MYNTPTCGIARLDVVLPNVLVGDTVAVRIFDILSVSICKIKGV